MKNTNDYGEPIAANRGRRATIRPQEPAPVKTAQQQLTEYLATRKERGRAKLERQRVGQVQEMKEDLERFNFRAQNPQPLFAQIRDRARSKERAAARALAPQPFKQYQLAQQDKNTMTDVSIEPKITREFVRQSLMGFGDIAYENQAARGS
jgi:hypothetical protein